MYIWETPVPEMNAGLQVEMYPQNRNFSRPSLSMHITKIHINSNIRMKKKNALFRGSNDGKNTPITFK